MDPRELAALVAREADAGVAGALGAWGASGALVPETVTARVASVPPAGASSPEDVVWQAEVRLRASSVTRTTAEPVPPSGAVAALPVEVLSGAGAARSRILASAGFDTVGALALATPAEIAGLARHGAAVLLLAGRARLATEPWPPLPAEAAGWGSVLEVSRRDPATLPGDRVLAHAAWAMCLQLVATVDAGVLAGLPVVSAPA